MFVVDAYWVFKHHLAQGNGLLAKDIGNLSDKILYISVRGFPS